MKASPEFSEAARQISNVWDQASVELRTAIRAAFDQASDRQSSYVNKLHLLLALLKDGRVRSHVTLAERDINKIELLITEKLRISGPHFDDAEGAALSNLPKWGSDFLAVLSDAANKKKHYRHPTIDVWLVFDLLACDSDLKGNFTYSQSGYANDHELRINEISELTKDRQAEVNQLKSDVRGLEADNVKLRAELDHTRSEFQTLAREFAQLRQQLVLLAPIERRLSQAEQSTAQLGFTVSHIQGTQESNAVLMHALLANIRTVQPVQPSGPASHVSEPVEHYGWFSRKRKPEPGQVPAAGVQPHTLPSDPPAQNGPGSGPQSASGPATVANSVAPSASQQTANLQLAGMHLANQQSSAGHIFGLQSVKTASAPLPGSPNGSQLPATMTAALAGSATGIKGPQAASTLMNGAPTRSVPAVPGSTPPSSADRPLLATKP